MKQLRLLDLYCGAGGAGEGYRLAGFDVTGIDINPQPKNPHNFIQGDAIEYLSEYGHEYDAIHASPPCQAYTKAAKQWRKEGRRYPDLISITRRLLQYTGKPWIIENVPGAPLLNPILLNGSVFNIRVHRPRLFETNFPIAQPEVLPMTPVKMGRPIKEGDIIQPVGHFSGVWYAAKEMGLPWMGQSELAQAIPPVYTQYISKYLLQYLKMKVSNAV
jgi:DNA (cytosine-5)-methyltransferase 1